MDFGFFFPQVREKCHGTDKADVHEATVAQAATGASSAQKAAKYFVLFTSTSNLAKMSSEKITIDARFTIVQLELITK